jgi:Protein of unknown function (DUF3572)
MQKRSGRTVLGPSRKSGLDRTRAEEIGLAALGFLAEEPQRLGRFLSLTGMAPGDLAARAAEPHMQAALLEHILADETLLLVFTAEKRIDPEHVAPACSLLEGGTDFNG